MIPISKGSKLKNSLEYASNPLAFILKKKAIHGSIFNANLGIWNVVMTSNPEHIKYMLQTNNKNWEKDLAYKQLKLAFGNGLLTSEGDYWLRQRRLAQQSFHKKQLEELFAIMSEISAGYFDELERKNEETKAINIYQEMTGLTADIALQSLFGSRIKEQQQQIYDSINFAQRYLMSRIRSPYMIPFHYLFGWKYRFDKHKRFTEKVIHDIITERRASNIFPSDLLSMLMQTEDADTGERMSDQQLSDEIKTIFVAGHETTANAMSWTIYLLAKHPAVYEKLRAEVLDVIGSRKITFRDIHRLTYTLQVIRESMRLYPPAWAVSRAPIEADELGGNRIEPGTIVIACIHAMHRDPLLWDSPEDFLPERFNSEAVKARPKSHYIPFGAGPRFCIGSNFAIMEMQLLLADICRRFSFELKKGEPVVPEALITLRPKNGIKIFLHKKTA